MKRSIILPVVTILAGVAGFFLRRQELSEVLDPSSPGWGVPGAVSLALIALCVLLLLTLILGCLRIAFTGGYPQAFAPPTPFHTAGIFLSAGLTAVAGVLSWREFSDFVAVSGAPGLTRPGNPLISRGLLGLMALIGCVALARLGLRAAGRGRKKPESKYSLSVLAPAFLCCIWLFAVYQRRAADPIVLGYIYVLLGVMSCALAGYFMAGFMYEKPKPRLTAVFGLFAVYLCGVCLAETGDMVGRMLFLAMGLYLLIASSAFLYNAERPRRAAAQPRETEELLDEE